jgi:Tfp pilus assembly protein PilN
MMIATPRAGLYLCDERLVVVVTPPGRRGAAQSFVLEAGELPGARLKAEFETRQIKLRRMRIGLARPLLTVKTLELPARGAQLAEMVAFELERHVPFPPEDMRFDFAPLSPIAGGPLRVLVVACERRTVEGALRLLEEPRLKPAAVSAACHDLPALLGRGQTPRSVIWAHRSATTTDLICLGGGRLEMSRTVPIKDAGELAGELASTLHLVGWAECDAIWISGDDAAELLAAPALTGLGPQVSEPPLRPAVVPLIQALPEENRGETILALAVALGSRRPILNLLPRELRPRTFSPEQIVTAGAAVLTALLGLSLLAGQGYQQHRYANRLSKAIHELDPDVKSVEALSADLAQKKRLLETIQGIERNDVRTLPILRELTERIPPEAWLRTLTMDKQGVEITGQAAAANQLIPLLENSPSLTRVEFTAPVTKAGDKEQFRIKAAWKNAPKTPEPTAKPTVATPPAPRGGAAKNRPGRSGDMR